MANMNTGEFLWVEKYRPQTIDECILPKSIKDVFKGYKDQGRIPTLLLSGKSGVGKTTVARALCNEVGVDVLFINASEDSGIDTLRTKIRQFASTTSLTESKKVVICDESDFLQANSTQPALRSAIEEFSENCTFIFTCNFKNSIIEPIHSRCAVIDFKIDSKEKPKLAAEFFKRITNIFKKEGIEFDPKVVAELITKFFPDYRRILNELQRYSALGKVDSGILVNLEDGTYKELINHLKDKDFSAVRKWVGQNSDIETNELFRMLYDRANTLLDKKSIPQLVLILGEYQFRSAFSVDPEINTMACLTEIMSQCQFIPS